MPNNHLPMLGAVANGGKTSWDRADHRCEAGFKRGNSPAHPDKPGQRRELRRAEQAELRAHLADELTTDEVPAPVADWADEAVALNAWGAFEPEPFDEDDDRLHAEALATLALMADAEARAFALDMLGGHVDEDGFASHASPTMSNLPFDPEDVQWGFTVR